MAWHTSNFCLCQRRGRAGKLWKHSLTVKISNYKKRQQDFISAPTKLGGLEPCSALEAHPSGTEQRQVSGFAGRQCSGIAAGSVLRLPEHPQTFQLLTARLLLFHLCTLKVGARLKKAPGREILQPIGNQMSGVQHSAQCKTETGLELELRQAPGIPQLRKVPVAVIESKMGHRIKQGKQELSAVR